MNDTENERPQIPATQNSVRSAWMLTALLVLAPLLMLITIWVLTALRVR